MRCMWQESIAPWQSCHSTAPAAGATVPGMQIEILLFDGFDELDAFGPFEALADVHDTAFVTLDGARAVTSDRGVRVHAKRALGSRPDALIVPGGGWFDRGTTGAWAEAERGVLTAAIAERHAAGSLVASVCTGAMLLARGWRARRPARDHQSSGDRRSCATSRRSRSSRRASSTTAT